MPCYDSRTTDPKYVCEDWIKQVNDLTNLLCSLCKQIEKGNLNKILENNSKVNKWWKKHKAEDNKKE